MRAVRAVKTIPYPQAACAGGVSDTDAIAALTLQAGAEIAAGQPVQARRGLRYVAQHRTLRGFALEARKDVFVELSRAERAVRRHPAG